MSASFPSILLEKAEASPPRDLLSITDFVQAVEVLAGELNKPRLAEFYGDDLEAVFVACPYEAWTQTFGEPRDIQTYQGVGCDSFIEVWEQACRDGWVHCVGHFVDDLRDGRWVVLMRVCLF